MKLIQHNYGKAKVRARLPPKVKHHQKLNKTMAEGVVSESKIQAVY
jgi:hypothetical protein